MANAQKHEEPNPQRVGKIMAIVRKLHADEDLNKEERKLLRALGVMPSAEWLDTLTLGLSRDFEHLFAAKGGHNKVYGGVNAAAKGAVIAYGGKKLYDYLFSA